MVSHVPKADAKWIGVSTQAQAKDYFFYCFSSLALSLGQFFSCIFKGDFEALALDWLIIPMTLVLTSRHYEAFAREIGYSIFF